MSKSDFLFVLFLAALAFLFTGEPDLWDNLHAAAMRSTNPTGCTK